MCSSRTPRQSRAGDPDQQPVSILVNLALMSEQFTAWWVETGKGRKTEKEKVQVQYLHLKNQVDPHFWFNALTAGQPRKQNRTFASQRLSDTWLRYTVMPCRTATGSGEPAHRAVFPGALYLTAKDPLRPALGIDIQIDKMQEKGIAMVSCKCSSTMPSSITRYMREYPPDQHFCG